MKKRTIMLSLVVLGFLLMIGVGFAAWTITNPNSGAAEAASVVAYDVDSEDYQLTLQFVTTAEGTAENTTPKIVFGMPATPGTATWLTQTDVATESLTLYLKVSVDKVENLPDTLPIAFACSKATEWSACTSGNYVAGPTYKIGGATVTSIAKAAFGSATEGAASCVLEINLAWGSAFGGANPYTYYNGLTYSSANATAASTALKAIYALNEASYTFTIGTVQPAA